MFEHAKWITRKPWFEWKMPSYEELPPAPYPFTFKLNGNTVSCQSGEYEFERQI